ncbi:YlxR family protein [Demequina sp. NBRC 110053]|uniref:YlxR family protein n=1 Tax=Demequina sp. NBRC 110053 TaxID=1570342 RepID=UPI0009FE18A3|nr:YlxR family protein [Demequina sp. NBRC 110053]
MKPSSPSGDIDARPHQPVRTCVGCRSKAPRSALVRLALEGGRVVVDERGTLPGRGAWLHPESDCLAQALRRHSIGRALRSPGADATGVALPGSASPGAALPTIEVKG